MPPRRSKPWCANASRNGDMFLFASAARQNAQFRSGPIPHFPRLAWPSSLPTAATGKGSSSSATGQQVVVDGIHPDTGKTYDWFGGRPGDIKRDDLPYI